jgi:hypothetical protein
MAPGSQGFFHVSALKAICGHVSGLVARREAAGPDGFRGSRSDQARGVALPHVPSQVSLDPSVDRRCHHASSPSQVLYVRHVRKLHFDVMFSLISFFVRSEGRFFVPTWFLSGAARSRGQDWPRAQRGATAEGARAAVLRAASTAPGSPRSGHG